jgi:uncharacterized protein YrzB (UPF0473 family)
MTNDFNDNEQEFMYLDLQEDEDNNIVELTDENGEVTRFEYLATIELDDNEYVLLSTLDDNTEDEGDYAEVVILKIEQDENGEDVFVTCDDPDEAQEVFDLFEQMLEDEEN